MVLAYDVSANRRRSKLFRRLKALVPWVQKSVFEGPVPPSHHRELRRAVTETIDPSRDTVRVYHLCAACRERTELYGVAAAVPPEPEDVVVE